MDKNTAVEFTYTASQLNLSIMVSVKFMSQGEGDKEIANRIGEEALHFLEKAEEIILNGSLEAAVGAVGSSADKRSSKEKIGFKRPE